MLCRVGGSESRVWAPLCEGHNWYVGGERSKIIRLCETGLSGSGDRWSGCLRSRRGVGCGVAPCHGSAILLFPIGVVARHNIRYMTVGRSWGTVLLEGTNNVVVLL
jgi:hypothetical protein